MGYGRLEGKCSSVGLDMFTGPGKMWRVEEQADMISGSLHAFRVAPLDGWLCNPLTLVPTMTVPAPLLFSTFEVTRQAFHRTALSYAIVNLKPIVPGRESRPSLIHPRTHPPQDVLVIPTRVVPRLTDLTTPELTSLMSSIQHVGRAIEKAYSADSLTVACQVVPTMI